MRPILFYDGSCALCHGFVRWVVARDRAGIFCFAPLQGATFAQLVASTGRASLPDSLVVRDEGGQVLVRSQAVLFVLRRLGHSGWARFLAVFPRPLRDWGYALVAAVRYRIFGRKQELCPPLPPDLRERFLD